MKENVGFDLTMYRQKLKNRRVSMGTLNGTYYMIFKALDREAPKGQRVRVTKLSLSTEAMDAVVNLYFFKRGEL